MRVKTWKVLDFGKVPEHSTASVDFTCCKCGREARLPVVGRPLAQIEHGLVFDIGPHAMPSLIQCRKCGTVSQLAHVR